MTVHEVSTGNGAALWLGVGDTEQAASKILLQTESRFANNIMRDPHSELGMPTYQATFGVQKFAEPSKSLNCFFYRLGIFINRLNIKGFT